MLHSRNMQELTPPMTPPKVFVTFANPPKGTNFLDPKEMAVAAKMAAGQESFDRHSFAAHTRRFAGVCVEFDQWVSSDFGRRSR